MIPDGAITGAECQAMRQSLFLSRDEFAELACITPLELRQHEADNKPVPGHLATFLVSLIDLRNQRVDEINKLIRRRKRKYFVHLLWYTKQEDFTSLPENTPLSFRAHQSALAEFALTKHVRLVRFDAKRYANWLESCHKTDSTTTRADWAAQQELFYDF